MEKTKKYRRLSNEKRQLIKELYENGLSGVEISQQFGCDPCTVYKWVRLLGLQVRDFSSAAKLRYTKYVNPMKGKLFSSIHNTKLSISLLKKWKNPIYRKHVSDAHKGQKAWNKGLRGYKSNISEKGRQKISLMARERMLNDNPMKTQENKLKLSLRNKNMPIEHYYKMWQNSRRRPSKPELKLQNLIERIGLQFKYVGNSKFFVGRANPDFVNIDERQIIELYGDYWHRYENPQNRINYFNKNGYSTLIIWEHELKDESAVMTKVLDFTKTIPWLRVMP